MLFSEVQCVLQFSLFISIDWSTVRLEEGWVHPLMYTVKCNFNTEQFTLKSEQCKMYSVECIQCTMYSVDLT